jgi:tRNA pseudouridine55 synthase
MVSVLPGPSPGSSYAGNTMSQLDTTDGAAAGGASARGGILLVDKPGGMTSHDVVARVRRLAGTRKVGHAGTLDPMATGLLILGLNSSTRLLSYLVGLDKEYLATIRLGSSMTTDDAEGETVDIASASEVDAITVADVGREIAQLTGEIQQVPSSFSAIKVGGKRAYALARAGEAVELAARTVTISTFELVELTREQVAGDDEPQKFLQLEVRVECSSGTYIRALARDLGSALGIGGYLTSLRRTRIGPFSAADAAELDSLDVADRLLAPAAAAGRLFPSIRLTESQAVDLGHGKRISVEATVASGPIAALTPDGRLIGLIDVTGELGKSIVNFPADS